MGNARSGDWFREPELSDDDEEARPNFMNTFQKVQPKEPKEEKSTPSNTQPRLSTAAPKDSALPPAPKPTTTEPQTRVATPAEVIPDITETKEDIISTLIPPIPTDLTTNVSPIADNMTPPEKKAETKIDPQSIETFSIATNTRDSLMPHQVFPESDQSKFVYNRLPEMYQMNGDHPTELDENIEGFIQWILNGRLDDIHKSENILFRLQSKR